MKWPASASAEELTRALDGRWYGSYGQARCPAHDDRNPSLTVRDGEDGKVLVFCNAGCSQYDVVVALKDRNLWNSDHSARAAPTRRKAKPALTPLLPVPEDAPRKIPPHRLGKPSATWTYRDNDGRLLFVVCRFDHDGGKDILPLTYCRGPEGQCEWRWQGVPTPRPLYGLDCLAQRPDAEVLVVEGEKAADAAQERFPDMVVITWPGGVNSVASADWSPLRSRAVVVWPDNDAPGMEAAQAVLRTCTAAGAVAVRVVALPPELPEKWDLADELPEGWTSETPQQLLSEADVIDRVDVDIVEGEALLVKLARLQPIEYDRRRKDEAERLGCRVTTLDKQVEKARLERAVAEAMTAIQSAKEDEVADIEVDGAELLGEITDLVNEHVIVAPGVAEVCAAFVLHTYTMDAADVSPILEITSPIMRCGKTTLARLLRRMCNGAIMASNISPAALYRVIGAYSPTLVIDEADSFLTLSDELRGLLNSGHTRDGAFVMRCEGDSLNVVTFSTWGPKILALIDRPPATVQDRAITVHMERKQTGQSIRRLPRVDTFTLLRKRCARWAQDNIEALKDREPTLPDGLNDREADNWYPLFAIAEVVGGDWPQRLEAAASQLAGTGEEEGVRIMLLGDVNSVFDTEETTAISSQTLVDKLVEMEGRPWPEFRRGKPLTSNQLARMLKPFHIAPVQIWTDGSNKRGYRKDQFDDVWQRYTPNQTARPLDAKEPAGFSPNQTARNSESLAVENPLKAMEPAGSSTLAVGNGGADEQHAFPGQSPADDDEIAEWSA